MPSRKAFRGGAARDAPALRPRPPAPPLRCLLCSAAAGAPLASSTAPTMLGFGAHPASVDWSFFGGLEELPPHLHGTVPTRATQRAAAAKAAAAATTAAAKAAAADRPEASATSSAAAPRPAASAYRPYVRGGGDLSSESASSDSDAPPAATGTPPTSDEEEATRPAALPVQTDWKAQERMREQMKKGVQASQLGLVADAEEAKRRGALPAGYPWVPKKADTPPPTDDFLWLLTEEPHRSRRWAILKAHPEVKSLMGYEPLTKWVSGFVTLLQIGVGIGLSYSGWSWLDWRLLLLTYVVGATATHNLFLAIHEITHNLAFRSIDANRTWSIVTNLPIGIPYAMMFKRYHMEHHKYMGEDGIDTDLPSRLELWCLNNVLGKAFFAYVQSNTSFFSFLLHCMSEREGSAGNLTNICVFFFAPSLQYIPNSVLCIASRIHPVTTVDLVARAEHRDGHPVRCLYRSKFWLYPFVLLFAVGLPGRKLASLRGPLHCGALPLRRDPARDVVVLRAPELVYLQRRVPQ